MTKTDRQAWSLLIDGAARSGAWNMALDEYLFDSLGGNPGTTLRFYRWKRPTISLGYSQKVEKVVDLEYCRNHGIDIVRRLTGGKLVLHHREVTYSICSSDISLFPSTVMDTYRMISEALIKGLENMGLSPRLADVPPHEYTRGNLPCFSYPALNEIEIGGKKIIGSAQKRIGGTFLQHGSIPLVEDDGMLRSVSLLDVESEDLRMISLSTALGRPVGFDWVVERLQAGIADLFGVAMIPRALFPAETQNVLHLQRERYENPAWTGLF